MTPTHAFESLVAAGKAEPLVDNFAIGNNSVNNMTDQDAVDFAK